MYFVCLRKEHEQRLILDERNEEDGEFLSQDEIVC